jgi:hypothetical protein
MLVSGQTNTAIKCGETIGCDGKFSLSLDDAMKMEENRRGEQSKHTAAH